jgi:hypothetical protein
VFAEPRDEGLNAVHCCDIEAERAEFRVLPKLIRRRVRAGAFEFEQE